jgi:hypothetical protein
MGKMMKKNKERERREEDRETRDMAVRALSMVQNHMSDCTSFRVAMSSTVAEFRKDLKELRWQQALIVGGLTIAGWAANFFFK